VVANRAHVRAVVPGLSVNRRALEMDRRSLLRIGASIGGFGLADASVGSAAADDQAYGGICLPNESELLMQVYANVAGSVTLSYRLMTMGGELSFGSQTLQFSASAGGLIQLQVPAGYLVSVMAAANSPPSVLRGDVFVSCQVSGIPLFQDYLQSNLFQGWPGGRQLSSVEGPGGLYPLAVANPAAGQDWRFTVPSGARWLLHSLTMTLTTSAAAQERLTSFVVDPSQTQFAAIVPQQPNTAVAYQLARGPEGGSLPLRATVMVRNKPRKLARGPVDGPATPGSGGVSSQGYSLIHAGLPLPLTGGPSSGFTVGSATIGLAPDDRWSAIAGFYEQRYQDSM